MGVIFSSTNTSSSRGPSRHSSDGSASIARAYVRANATAAPSWGPRSTARSERVNADVTAVLRASPITHPHQEKVRTSGEREDMGTRVSHCGPGGKNRGLLGLWWPLPAWRRLVGVAAGLVSAEAI